MLELVVPLTLIACAPLLLALLLARRWWGR